MVKKIRFLINLCSLLCLIAISCNKNPISTTENSRHNDDTLQIKMANEYYFGLRYLIDECRDDLLAQPLNPLKWDTLAAMYQQYFFVDSAIYYTKIGLKYAPNNECLLERLGNLYTIIDQQDSAAYIFNKILEINEENLTALFGLVYTTVRQAHPDFIKALKLLKRIQPLCEKKYPEQRGNYYAGLSFIYWCMGEDKKAIQYKYKANEFGVYGSTAVSSLEFHDRNKTNKNIIH